MHKFTLSLQKKKSLPYILNKTEHKYEDCLTVKVRLQVLQHIS
jgi:hypothetical protein